jgi:DNA polymerase I
MTRPDGTPVNAVYGFTTMLMKLLKDTDADHLAVVFDAARHTFRNEIYPAYKAQRPDPPEELIPQFALIRDAVNAFNVACIEAPGYEADDLIATYARLAREAGAEVTIVSSDKDLMQLICDGVAMFDPMNNRPIRAEEVKAKFGVEPERVIDVQALAGDAVDNVPGVPGIGIKTAAQLIVEYGDLEGLLARAGEIKQPKRRQALIEHAEAARISKQLVALRDDVPVPAPLAELAKREPDRERLQAFLQAQAFKSLLARIDAPASPAPVPGVATKASGEAPSTGDGVYELVTDEAALQRWIDAATAAGNVAVDTETTSLDAMRAELVGVSLALKPGQACYIPLAHRSPDGPLAASAPIVQIDREKGLALLKPLLEDDAVLKIGQNIKYDMEVLAHYGIAVTPIDDTMLCSYVLEGGLHGHGMDELAELHLNHQTVKYAEVAGSGKQQVTFDLVPLDQALRYAAEDADVTLRLHQALKPRLLAEHLLTVYETIERPLVPILAAMERTGVLTDAAQLARLSLDFARRLEELEAEIHQLAGLRFNIGSPKQLGEVLFDKMGLAGGRKGKTGAYATGAEVLEDLAAQGLPLPSRVLDWRQLAKLKSTYTDALTAQINPVTGRVHTSYQQAVASTGRLSSSDPNLQNIPVRTQEGRKIRRAFVAPQGCVLLSADYSQIELRLLAHVADIGALKDAFRDGLDIHAMTASQVFGVPVEGMDPLIRRKAKAINFGIVYGISAFGLARQLGITRGEAATYIDAYFDRYPGIRDYMERAKADARTNGYVTTLFGRRCHARGIADRNPSVRNFAERAAINAPIQGGAADIIKRAMIRMPDALAAAGLTARMLLQVHDELVFEVPETEAAATRELVKREMESVARLSVPLVVDTGIGANWDEAH